MMLTKYDRTRDTLLEPIRSMDRFFDEFFGRFMDWPRVWEEDSVVWAPRMDVKETKNAFEIKADLPGMKKEDIKISIEDGVLTIKGERRYEEEQKDEDRYYMERAFGTFSRSFTLPTKVNEKDIKATYKDGVLSITLPKAEDAKPKEIEIR